MNIPLKPGKVNSAGQERPALVFNFYISSLFMASMGLSRFMELMA